MEGKKILLGVTGSIAAYKAAELARLFSKAGAQVRVAMTPSATRFITPLTFEALTQKPVLTSLGTSGDEIQHVERAHDVDAVVIAPATANTIARMAHGFADDAVLATVLSTTAPVLVAPAMETGMWTNAATRKNVAQLIGRGVTIVPPGSGALASGRSGVGRLAELPAIVEAVRARLAPDDLSGLRFVVTAGPTREPIDPVRLLSNRSTGAMGIAIATSAMRRGARVDLILGPTHLAPPEPARSGAKNVFTGGCTTHRVETAEEMLAAGRAVIDAADVLIATAAVSDFRPKDPWTKKLKRSAAAADQIALVENPDILATLAAEQAARPERAAADARPLTVIGFAAETENIEAEARRKLEKKGCDAVIGNLVGKGVGFGPQETSVLAVTSTSAVPFGPAPKAQVAEFVLDQVVRLRGDGRQ